VIYFHNNIYIKDINFAVASVDMFCVGLIRYRSSFPT